MITRKELIKKYIEFFKSKNHKEIPNSSLIPENDPTVLFTTAGMHPLVPFLSGQSHPQGKRLTNVQRCIRTGDIEEVGDTTHHTFFEMLGNWSLGDYGKKEAIELSFEFLTKILKIPKAKISITCFEGDKNSPKDIEAEKIWKSFGINKIKFLGKKDNWWGPAGKTGPCGPDTEIFINNIEIWNNVFMEYEKRLKKVTILVDGMHCLYNKNFELNENILKLVENFNTWNILVVNKFIKKGYKLVDKSNWASFSLEEKEIKKDDPEYFKRLLKTFRLTPEEVIYFDHQKENVEVAKKLKIKSMHYTGLESLEKFIKENIYEFPPAKQKNIDTGMGVERTIAILNNLEDNYLTECFKPIIEKIEELSGKKYKDNKKEMRIIADHIKASVFMINDGIVPGNTEQGYVLRRLIRRAIRNLRKLDIEITKINSTSEIAKKVFEIYPEYKLKENLILSELKKEENKFQKSLDKGLKEFEKMSKDKKIDGKESFLLYQSYGFPIEMIEELCKENKLKFSKKGFEKELSIHQQLSRTASAGKFKSGLADNSETTTKLHTATHLLLAALKTILKDKNIIQKGSNINPERLRFDFNFERKLTDEEKKQIEELVNQEIEKNQKVTREEMSPKKAKESGAEGIFDAKYGEKVSVYTIGKFSKEICTGPHVENTSELGKFKIQSEKSSSAGVRRIKAILE